MSSETSQISGITSVSYRFVLKWIVKGKDLKYHSGDTANASVIRSDMYLFKPRKDIRFYLEIDKSRYYHDISIKGTKMWSFEIAYAFLVSKDTAFQLKASYQLSFLSKFCSSNIVDEEDFAIHCVVIADPVQPSPSTEKVLVSSDEDYLTAKEGQYTVDIEGRPLISLLECYSNKMVKDFIRRGDIPDFDVSRAIEIIRSMKEHKCEVLKILCVQYLKQNITSQSVRAISRAAIDCGLPELQRVCLEKIADGYIQTK